LAISGRSRVRRKRRQRKGRRPQSEALDESLRCSLAFAPFVGLHRMEPAGTSNAKIGAERSGGSRPWEANDPGRKARAPRPLSTLEVIAAAGTRGNEEKIRILAQYGSGEKG